MNDNCKEGSNDKNKHKNRNSRQMVPTQACWENECLGIKSFQQPPTPFPLSLPQTKQKSVKFWKRQIQIMKTIFLDCKKIEKTIQRRKCHGGSFAINSLSDLHNHQWDSCFSRIFDFFFHFHFLFSFIFHFSLLELPKPTLAGAWIFNLCFLRTRSTQMQLISSIQYHWMMMG